LREAVMANSTGESESDAVRLDFDRRLMLQFRGSVVRSDAGLLAYRELDDALGLTVMAGEMLADTRTGKNGRHDLIGMLRQSVFGRLAEYEDVNDAERLRHDPVMRWIVGGKAAQGCAASPSQMGRFETRWLAASENLSALVDLSGQWIDLVHGRRPPHLGNFLRTLATPEPIKDWSLTSLKEKLIKIGAKVVSHGRYIAFQMAEVAIPRQMFQEILRLIAELRPQPPPTPA
jgi:hypothetical protein